MSSSRDKSRVPAGTRAPNISTPAVVSPTKEPRSYLVQATEGARYHRNGKFLRKITKLPPNIPNDHEDVNTTPNVFENDSPNQETVLSKSHVDKTPSGNGPKKCVTSKTIQNILK